MRSLLLFTGVVGLLVGLLWIGQGLGWIAWPQESFMINDSQWSWYGAAVAAVGIALIWFSRR